MNIELKDFSHTDLINQYKDDHIVFIIISKMKDKSYYDYRIANNGEIKPRIKRTLKENNRIAPILLALNDIVSKLPNNSNVHVVTSKPLRLESYAKSKRSKEVKFYNEFINLCKERVVTVEEIIVAKGEDAIRDIVKPKKQKSLKTNNKTGHTKKHDPYVKYKPIKIETNEFSFSKFMKSNGKDVVLFVNGSCDNELNIGWYLCRVCKNTSVDEKISSEKFASNSPNDAMLRGIFDYCKDKADNNSILHVVAPAEIGFNHPTKSINNRLLMQIFAICDTKKIDLRVVHVNGGGEKLRNIIVG